MAISEDIDAMGAIIKMVQNAMNLGGVGKFTDYGEKLLHGLTAIAVAWSSIKNIAEQAGINKLFLDFAVIAITWGFASWVMTGYVYENGKDGKQVKVVDAINNGFEIIARGALPSDMQSSGGAKHVIEALGQSLKTATLMFKPNPEKANAPLTDAAKKELEKLNEETKDPKAPSGA